MFKYLKCKSCNGKIKKNFNFCPHCGFSLKSRKISNKGGIIGMNDMIKDIKMPFGLNTIMKSLAKQLDKEIGTLNFNNPQESNNPPRGFKIQISTGKPSINNLQQEVIPKQQLIEEVNQISKKELLRRKNLEKVKPISTIRRLPEGLIYEISVPGIKNKKEISVINLENSIEIKAYSKDKCYEKIIPIKSEIISYKIKDGKILLKLKS